MTKPGIIIADMLILAAVSTIFVGIVNAAFSGLKKGAKSDPMVTATLQGDTNAVVALLKNPATDADKPDHYGRTPLLWAAYVNYSSPARTAEEDRKRAPIVRLLLDHKVQIGTRDNDGWTALMWASWSGLTQVTGILLEHGADASVADRQGNTALALAAQRGNVDIVRLLLTKGADKAAVTRTHKTALDLAKLGMEQYPAKKDAYTGIVAALQ